MRMVHGFHGRGRTGWGKAIAAVVLVVRMRVGLRWMGVVLLRKVMVGRHHDVTGRWCHHVVGWGLSIPIGRIIASRWGGSWRRQGHLRRRIEATSLSPVTLGSLLGELGRCDDLGWFVRVDLLRFFEGLLLGGRFALPCATATLTETSGQTFAQQTFVG